MIEKNKRTRNSQETYQYERTYRDFNKNDIISKIKTMGFKKKGKFLFKVQSFSSPKGGRDQYIRVRDEGHRVTVTHKKYSKKDFAQETEIIVDNFEKAIKLLEKIGCKKKHYYEKTREIWFKNKVEISFDKSDKNSNDNYMDIESNSEV